MNAMIKPVAQGAKEENDESSRSLIKAPESTLAANGLLM